MLDDYDDDFQLKRMPELVLDDDDDDDDYSVEEPENAGCLSKLEIEKMASTEISLDPTLEGVIAEIPAKRKRGRPKKNKVKEPKQKKMGRPGKGTYFLLTDDSPLPYMFHPDEYSEKLIRMIAKRTQSEVRQVKAVIVRRLKLYFLKLIRMASGRGNEGSVNKMLVATLSSFTGKSLIDFEEYCDRKGGNYCDFSSRVRNE